MKTRTSWGGPNGVSATCSANKQQPGDKVSSGALQWRQPTPPVPSSDALQCQAM